MEQCSFSSNMTDTKPAEDDGNLLVDFSGV